jgi:hypothetical protein
MKLPKFKTLEEIPEAFREGYVEKDGEWVPDVDDVTPLKSAHERQKEETRQAKEKLKELERQLAEAKKKAGGMTDEEIAARRAEIEAEVAPVREKLTAAEKELRTLKFDDRLKALIAGSGTVAKRVDALHRLIGDRFDLNESGTLVLKDKPTTDIAKYLKEDIAKEYPEFFESKQKGGSEFNGSGNGTPVVPADLDKTLNTNPALLLQAANTAK